MLSLLRCFLDVQHGATLVRSALGASVMGKLLLVAVGALGYARGRQEVVRAAKCSAARGMAPFRIRHDAIPFVSSPTLFRFARKPHSVFAAIRTAFWHGRDTLNSRGRFTRTLPCCEALPALPSGGLSDPLRSCTLPGFGSCHSAGKVLCSQACTAF